MMSTSTWIVVAFLVATVAASSWSKCSLSDQLVAKRSPRDLAKFASKDVVELTDANFDRLVLDSNDIWLVAFCSSQCIYCRKLAPHWAKAARALEGKAKLGVLDIDVHDIKSEEYEIRYTPTIIFFPGGLKDSEVALEYVGGRNASEIVSWVRAL